MTSRDARSVLGLQSATDAAASWIRSSILSGRFKPGARLIELTLAKTLGIGQPTVREALKELELQGFVRKIPKHGTYVTQLEHIDYCEILETRVALEEVAVRRAAVRAGSDDLRRFRELQEGMLDASKTVDRSAFHAFDMEFHRGLWELAGNAYLSETLEKIAFSPFVFFILERTKEETASLQAAAESHKPIIDGIETGDPDTAGSMYREATLTFWKMHHGIECPNPRAQ